MTEGEEAKNINKKLEYHLIIIGDSCVGKSVFFRRIKQDFYSDYSVANIGIWEYRISELNNKEFEIVLHDLQEWRT